MSKVDKIQELVGAQLKGLPIQKKVHDLSGIGESKWMPIIKPLTLKELETNYEMYRIKPEPKLVAYTSEDMELLRGKWLKHKNAPNSFTTQRLIVAFYKTSVGLGGTSVGLGGTITEYSYDELKQHWTFLDGSPCGHIIEE